MNVSSRPKILKILNVTTMNNTKPKGKLQQLLDNLIDEEGLKTEVTVTLTNSTLLRASLFFFATYITVKCVSALVQKGL